MLKHLRKLYTQLRRRRLAGDNVLCRLLILKTTRLKTSFIIDLIRILRKISHRDPLLEELSTTRGYSHSDGWGYIFFSRTSNTIYFYRSLSPIYLDEHGFKDLIHLLKSRENEEVFMLIHVRKASEKEPIGLIHVHPYMHRYLGKELYLVHNGSFNKEKLSNIINIKDYNKVTDSYLGLLYYSTLLKRGYSPLEALDTLLKATREGQGSVVGILSVENSKQTIYYGFKVSGGGKYVRYYRPYIHEWDGGAIVVSSSITLYASNIDFKPVKEGSYIL